MSLGARAASLALAIGISLSPLDAHAQDRGAETRTQAPLVGGTGGAPFSYACPPGAFLTGIRARQGDWIDQVSAVCSRWDASAGAMVEVAASPAFGGNGGSPATMRCAGRGVIGSMSGLLDPSSRDRTVNYVTFFCVDPFDTSVRLSSIGENSFGSRDVGITNGSFSLCGPNRIAAGLHGRSGAFVDAIGLVCTERLVPPRSVKPVYSARAALRQALEAIFPPPPPTQ